MLDLFASPWIPTAGMILLACGARLLSKSWLAPGPFALLTWSIYLVVPLIVLRGYPIAAIGAWLILSLVLCMAIGAELGIGQGRGEALAGRAEGAAVGPLLNLNLIFSGVSLLGALYSLWKGLSDYSQDLSLTGFLALGHLLSVERYSGDQPPFLVRILVIWVFSAALLGGISFAKARSRKERLLCLAPLIPAILLSLVQATRANTLMVFAVGLSGYLAMSLVQGRSAGRLFDRRSLSMAAASVALGLSFFFLVDAVRTHGQEKEFQLDTDWGRAKSSAVGYLAVFSHWASRPEGPGGFHPAFGAYTFGGVLDAVGLHRRQTGVYSEYVSLEGDESNIYTAFRSLIDDFSLPGAMALSLVLGFLAGSAYKKSLVGSEIWSLTMAGFYAFLIWSPLGSLFVYNGPILALLVAGLALRRAAKKATAMMASDKFLGRHLRTT